VDRVVGLEDVQVDVAMLQTPDGNGRVELARFHSPPSPDGERDAPANSAGIRHVTFAVDDIDAAVDRLRARGGELVGEIERYDDIYRLCYLRGPAGISVELAQRIGRGPRPRVRIPPGIGRRYHRLDPRAAPRILSGIAESHRKRSL
jgi:hypothetical protein